MSSDFLPDSDKELIAWASRFITIATANITATQLSSAQIAALNTKTQEAQAASNDADAKRKAAEAATLVKKDKIALLTTNAREINRVLQGNLIITAETKFKLGLKVRPAKRKPIALVVPTKLQVVGNPGRQNILSWDANGNPPNTLYEVQASYGEGEPYFLVTALIGTRYVHQGVRPGQEMIYRVRAKRRTKYSDYSSLITVYPNIAPELKMPKLNMLELKKAA